MAPTTAVPMATPAGLPRIKGQVPGREEWEGCAGGGSVAAAPPLCFGPGILLGIALLGFAGLLAVAPGLVPSAEASGPRTEQEAGGRASAGGLAHGLHSGRADAGEEQRLLAVERRPPPTVFPRSSGSGSSESGSGSGSSGESSGSSSAKLDQTAVWVYHLVAHSLLLIVTSICWCCFACIYKTKVVDEVIKKKGDMPPHRERDESHFKFGLFQCFNQPWVCIHGWLCPYIRAAQTNDVGGVLEYWPTFVVYMLAHFLSYCCCGLCVCLFNVYFRRILKQQMGLRDHPTVDLCVACCCWMCANCQQSAAVDEEMGYKVTGCCNIEWLSDKDADGAIYRDADRNAQRDAERDDLVHSRAAPASSSAPEPASSKDVATGQL